jgi:hypothetical protein
VRLGERASFNFHLLGFDDQLGLDHRHFDDAGDFDCLDDRLRLAGGQEDAGHGQKGQYHHHVLMFTHFSLLLKDF